MKPGETTLSCASIVFAAETFERSPMETIVSPRTPTSPRYHGAPVPSMMRPLMIFKSSMAGFGAVAQAAAKREKAETRNQKENLARPVAETFLVSAFCFLLFFIAFLSLNPQTSAGRGSAVRYRRQPAPR